MSASPRFDPDCYPLLLPHFGYHDGAAYFGTTRVVGVSKREGWFLVACDGTKTLARVASETGVASDFIASIADWLVWWRGPVPPLKPARAQRELQRLVLSATPEQPWLGMGGRLLLESPQASTGVLQCFQTQSGWHDSGFRTAPELALACSDEAATAARLSSVGFEELGIPEFASRQWSELSDEVVTDVLRHKLGEVLAARAPREVFVPAGMADQHDGRLLLDVALSLVGEGVLTADVHVYEDAPAIDGELQVDDFVSRFAGSFLVPKEYFEHVASASHDKQSVLDVFRHRLSTSQGQAWRRSSARNARAAGPPEATMVAERFWSLEFTNVEYVACS